MTSWRPRSPWAFYAVLALLVGILVSVPVSAGAQDTEGGDAFVLTVLHNNDGESKLLPDEGSDPGVARFVALMKQLQSGASGDGVVTLTSGDKLPRLPGVRRFAGAGRTAVRLGRSERRLRRDGSGKP